MMFDAYGNHVHKGSEILLNVDGFLFLDQMGSKRKACENALLCLQMKDILGPKTDDFFENVQVIEKIKRLKDVAVASAASRSSLLSQHINRQPSVNEITVISKLYYNRRMEEWVVESIAPVLALLAEGCHLSFFKLNKKSIISRF